MEDLISTMYRLLEDLDKKEMKKFKSYLNTELLHYKPIASGKLADADVTDTVDLMKKNYGTKDLLNITVLILEKIPRRDLISNLQIPTG